MAKTRVKAKRGALRRAAPKRAPLKRAAKNSATNRGRKRRAPSTSKPRKTITLRSKRGVSSSSKRGVSSSKSTLASAALAVGRVIGRTVAVVAERAPWGNGPVNAIELLDGLLSRPSGVTVALLRLDPAMDQLRDDRRFQELLQKYGDRS